ncbi:hypothetical protein [Vibrio parahaemolyticus]|uniref:hypothetical protein n=1 Tax=Vibrio parahaemolyticus TaxID=670 RepID=UPI0015DFA80F|nr:hypothetical protein [Vibrio parahaemolyticus]MCG6438293.1 hypothetical protein [Vibrio parahaemolyticus]
MIRTLLTTMVTCLMLVGCGGGGGDSDPNNSTQTVEGVGTLTVIPELSQHYIGSYRTEKADLTFYNNYIDFDVKMHGSDNTVKFETNEQGVRIRDSEGELLITSNGVIFTSYMNGHKTVFETDEFDNLSGLTTAYPDYINYLETEVRSRHNSNAYSGSSEVRDNHIVFQLLELDTTTNQYQPYIEQAPYLNIQYDSYISVPDLPLVPLGDGRYRSAESIDGTFLYDNSKLGEEFKNKFIEEVSASCGRQYSHLENEIGALVVEVLDTVTLKRLIKAADNNIYIDTAYQWFENHIKDVIKHVIQDAVDIPTDLNATQLIYHRVLCSEEGNAVLDEFSNYAVVEHAKGVEVKVEVNGLPFHTTIGKTFTHQLGGNNTEREVRLIGNQAAILRAGLYDLYETELELKNGRYQMVEKQTQQMEVIIENIEELTATVGALTQDLQTNIDQIIELRMLINGSDNFKDGKTFSLDELENGKAKFKFPAGEQGVVDSIQVAFGIRQDVELRENVQLGAIITGKVINQNGVAIEDTTQTQPPALTCPDFGYLNVDGMTYDEAVQHCTSNGTTLPSLQYVQQRFGAFDSFSEICGAPTGQYWLQSSSASTTAWAMNSAMMLGNTVWLKERPMEVVCVGTGDSDYVRQPISQ